MKPSERIGEIYIEICNEQGDDPLATASMPLYIMAIQKYLDETWEKEQIALKKLEEDLKDKK